MGYNRDEIGLSGGSLLKKKLPSLGSDVLKGQCYDSFDSCYYCILFFLNLKEQMIWF